MRLGVFVLLISVTALAPALQPTSAPASAPTSAPVAKGVVLYPETDTWDFGSVWYGDKPEGQIKLSNNGDVPLRIARVAPSCACTTADVAKKELQPGEETVLSLAFDTTKTRDRFPEQQVTLITEPTGRENLFIRVKG